MSNRLVRIAGVWLGLSGFLAHACAQNFTSADPELARVAEEARVRSARFWSGQELSGRWSTPCPIIATPASHSGGGRTEFTFSGGEVFGWRMQISGRRENLLSDVLPHEVDHMVRATLVRHPIERWLDEGCASLFESPESHVNLRRTALALDAARITPAWLETRDYPGGAAEQAAVYALGFSLVEFLLSRQLPGKLLELQRDQGSMESRLQRHYGLNIVRLQSEWDVWRRKVIGPECVDRCPLHGRIFPLANSTDREVLWVWTAPWCEPCRRFHHDLEKDAQFRSALTARFDVRLVDVDRQPVASKLQGITSLPTFQRGRERWSGYVGAEDLLRRLGLSLNERVVEPSSLPGEVAVPAPNAGEVPASLPPLERPESNALSSAAPAQNELPGPRRSATGWWRLIPVTLSALQWTGVLGGTFATGGVGGMALAAGWWLVRRRWMRRHGPPEAELAEEGGRTAGPAPFPRRLDEARELVELRRSEGRVAVLDTLRGMFLDDELDKLSASGQETSQKMAESLRTAIDARVAEVAPLTVGD